MPPHETVRAPAASARSARAVALPALVAVLALLAAPGAGAQQVEDVFEGFGTATTVEDAGETAADAGTVGGQVLDGETGLPIAGVTVILIHAASAGAEQEVRTTDGGGGYEFGSVPEGRYELQFIKAGYRTSKITGTEVVAGPTVAAAVDSPVSQGCRADRAVAVVRQRVRPRPRDPTFRLTSAPTRCS